MTNPTRVASALSMMLISCPGLRADDAPKPRVAVFPLAGDATDDQRDKIGFSLRTKLDRDGHYDPVDGPTMAELTAGKTVDLSTEPSALLDMAKDEKPTILIWGRLDAAGPTLDLKTLDLRDPSRTPHETKRAIKLPTDMRFVVEDVLTTLRDVGKFDHPTEESVKDDDKSRDQWQKNPNLVPVGDFSQPGSWTGLLRSEKYDVPVGDGLPDTDKVVIYRQHLKKDDHAEGFHAYTGGPTVLAMKLSRDVAESNGLACLSSPIPIRPNTRYRLQYYYRSDGPSLHVFVKGYLKGKDIAGKEADVQCYERQVPPSGGTHGKWEKVVCDLNPQSPDGPPLFLRIDLYTYLAPGTVMFDDVQLKAVGEPDRKMNDEAIKPLAGK